MAGYAALFFVGLSVGLMTLVYYERWLAGRARRGASARGRWRRVS